MGIFDFLQRKGSVGSVVKWTYKNYHELKSKEINEEKSNILKYMFNVRYGSHPALNKEAKLRLNGFQDDVEFDSLMELCTLIYYVEMDVAPQDGKLYQNTLKNAQIVLNKLNRKNNTNYK